MTMTGEENPKSLRGSEMRTAESNVGWNPILRGDAMTVDDDLSAGCRALDTDAHLLTWATWGHVDVWVWHAPLKSLDERDLILIGLTWQWRQWWAWQWAEVSCTDAELTKPFLTMIRLINAYEPLSTWTVVNLNDWADLWVLDCWTPQMLTLMVTLITWCWSPQTWPWDLMPAEVRTLMVSWSAWLMMMPADQDHQDEVKRWAPRWRMTVWPWTPWLSAWTLSLDQADFERRLWPSVGDTWSSDCRPFHWALQSCDWWYSWEMSWHTCRWCWLTHSREHDSAWTLTLILKLLTTEQMLWRSESDPWMMRYEDDREHLTWGWATWSRTDLLPQRTEDDLEAWHLTQLNMSLTNLMMMPMIHDEHNEPLWGRSCDRWHPEVTDEASSWGCDWWSFQLRMWPPDGSLTRGTWRTWCWFQSLNSASLRMNQWRWAFESMNCLKSNVSEPALKHDANILTSSDRWHMSILSDGSDAVIAYLTNDGDGSDVELTVSPDIAMSVLISADSMASLWWLLTMRTGSADTMTTSSDTWGWPASVDAASWADLIADDNAMITDDSDEVTDCNEANDAEAVSSDSEIESKTASVTKGWALDFWTDGWFDGCKQLNKKMTKPQNTE